MTARKFIPALLILFPLGLIVTTVAAHLWWKSERETKKLIPNAPFAASLQEPFTELSVSRHVEALHLEPRAIRAAAYIDSTLSLSNSGYAVERTVYNKQKEPIFEINLPAKQNSREIILVSVVYTDSSSTAAAISLAKVLTGSSHERTIRFAFIPNQEGAYFYAKRCADRGDRLVVVLSLEHLNAEPLQILADPISLHLQTLARSTIAPSDAKSPLSSQAFNDTFAHIYQTYHWPSLAFTTDKSAYPNSEILVNHIAALQSVILRFADPDAHL